MIHVPIHLLSPGDEELRRRLHERGDAEKSIESRIEDCRLWDESARGNESIRLIENGTKEVVLNRCTAVIDALSNE